MRHLRGRAALNVGLFITSQYLSWLFFVVIYPEADPFSLSPFLSFVHVFIEWCVVALVYNVFWGKSKFINGLCHLFALHALLIQTTQFLSLYNSQDYINAISLGHAGLIGLLVTPELIALFMASALVPAAFLLWLSGHAKRTDIGGRPLKRFAFAGGNFFFLAFMLVVKNNALAFKLERLSYPANKDSMVSSFWSELGKYGNVTPVKEPVISLSEDEIKLMAEHGIFLRPNSAYPLMKDFIYQRKMPFRKKPLDNKKRVLPTNMIVIFAESLNARMLESYNVLRKGLTPNIARFARDSMQVENYFNHAFPTIIGLRGQFCSVFPSMNNGAWSQGRFRMKTAANKCMPKMLSKNGYDTLYFGYSHPNETFFDDQMAEFGFEQRLFYDKLLETYHPEAPSPGRGHYGNSDRQMFESLIGFLESRRSKKNFFLAMSTVETHPGMDVLEPDSVEEKLSSPVLRIVHNFDKQFGKFWEYFQQSEYRDNTIVVLTADHAHVPNMDYIKIAGADYGRDRYFDPIALIIHDPTRELPKKFSTNGSSIDFAPSMLQLLEAPNEKNHFLGLSMFSDRPHYKGALGMVSKSRFFLNRAPDGKTTGPQIFRLSLGICESNTDLALRPVCALYKGTRFTQSLSSQNKLYAEE